MFAKFLQEAGVAPVAEAHCTAVSLATLRAEHRQTHVGGSFLPQQG